MNILKRINLLLSKSKLEKQIDIIYDDQFSKSTLIENYKKTRQGFIVYTILIFIFIILLLKIPPLTIQDYSKYKKHYLTGKTHSLKIVNHRYFPEMTLQGRIRRSTLNGLKSENEKTLVEFKGNEFTLPKFTYKSKSNIDAIIINENTNYPNLIRGNQNDTYFEVYLENERNTTFRIIIFLLVAGFFVVLIVGCVKAIYESLYEDIKYLVK